MKTAPRTLAFLAGGSLAIAAAAAVAAPFLGAAQTIDGMDIGLIRKRVAEQEREQAEFAREIQRRGEAVREDAVQVRDSSMRNMETVKADARNLKAGGNGINLDEMLADSGTVAKAGTETQPRFIAFASLSMPPAALKQVMREVGGSGGIVVFRGFPNNSSKEFMDAIGRVLEKGQKLTGVGIDPRLFRAFQVDAVPTYVVVSTDFQVCQGLNCHTPVPPHDRMAGNVTPSYALRTFAEGGGAGAGVAKAYLASLEKLQRP